uniref:Uncharacterized protein n=1 Tax=Leersia perrieri TaxID=77586 RepID=A0A0D9WF17_9ORYZ
MEVWRHGGQVARGPGGVSREAHSETPDNACGPLLLSMGSGSADGNLWWIRHAVCRASLADVGGRGDVYCDDVGDGDLSVIGVA